MSNSIVALMSLVRPGSHAAEHSSRRAGAAFVFSAFAPPVAAQLRERQDCGCTTTGAFVDPNPGQKPFIAANGDSAASSPKFRVVVTPVGPNVAPIVDVAPLVGGQPGPSRLTTSGLFWGFSPDQDRFLIWSITGSFPNVAIQSDLWDLTTTPASHRRAFGGAFTSKRFRFSNDGRYLLMAATTFGGTQIEPEWMRAATGDVRPSTAFPVNSPPGMVGDEFDVAGWGYGPDSSRVVYSYLSGGVPYTAVDDLEDGSPPIITAQSHISAFWQFSPCGDVFGHANQRFANQVEVNLWKTRGGAPIGFTAFNDLNVSLATTSAQHQASAPGNTVNVALNSASGACINASRTADFTVSGTLEAGQPISFTDASSDSDGTIVSWIWSFGDGGTSSSRNPTHVYAEGGSFDVVLRVTDNGGATHNRTRTISLCSAAVTGSGKLLYGDSLELYALNLDGSGVVRLTNSDHNGRGQISPVGGGEWSRDGSRIAWVADNGATFVGDGSGLWVSDADGSNARLILPRWHDFVEMYSPRWTPDGRAIAFVIDEFVFPTWRRAIHLIDADGTNLRPLNISGFQTGGLSNVGGFSGVPTCSAPPGGRIPDACWTLAVSIHVGNYDVEIWKVQGDGSGLTKITDGPADQSPSFSPDGTRLTFTRGFTPQTVYVANADGSAAVRVSSPPSASEDANPVWSPDGSQVAFTRALYPSGSITQRDLVVVGADGCHGSTVAIGAPYKQAHRMPGNATQSLAACPVASSSAIASRTERCGITVTAQWAGGSASAQTAADGSYRIDGIPIGVDITSVSASFPGYVWIWPGPIAGFSGYQFSNFMGHARGMFMSMDPDRITLEGTVRDENGNPVAGVTLEVTGSPTPVTPITTAADGRFSFDLRPYTVYPTPSLTVTTTATTTPAECDVYGGYAFT